MIARSSLLELSAACMGAHAYVDAHLYPRFLFRRTTISWVKSDADGDVELFGVETPAHTIYTCCELLPTQCVALRVKLNKAGFLALKLCKVCPKKKAAKVPKILASEFWDPVDFREPSFSFFGYAPCKSGGPVPKSRATSAASRITATTQVSAQKSRLFLVQAWPERTFRGNLPL